jgi:class 3 adenylate cyclase
MMQEVTTMTTRTAEPERAVIVFADLCGYEALTDARGDWAAADVAMRFAAMARASLSGGARLLKTLGDGVLIVAPDLPAAHRTAVVLRDLVRTDPELVPVRIGVCEGSVVWRDGDVFGATVNRAARLADAADPWEIREGITNEAARPAGTRDPVTAGR